MTGATVVGADITPLSGAPDAALTFGALFIFMNLLFVGFTVVQARAQGNRHWWVWGLITFAVPFLGYLVWRLFGAIDDGSPDQLLPR